MLGAIQLPCGTSTSYSTQAKQSLQQRSRHWLPNSRKSVACRQQRNLSIDFMLPHCRQLIATDSGEEPSSSSADFNIPLAIDEGRDGCLGQSETSSNIVNVTRKTVALMKHLLMRRGSFTSDRSRSRGRQDKSHWPLLSAVTTTVLPAGGWTDLGNNYIFVAGFWGWLIAQCLKVFTKRYKQGVWDIRAVIESGGMPSSHSSLCAAVTTAVALEFGLGSSLFAVALCFTVITMYDAAGVRRHAGKQAEVLNILLEDVLQGHPVSDRKLKEVLGHTPLQVVTGAVLGVVVACFIPSPTALPVV